MSLLCKLWYSSLSRLDCDDLRLFSSEDPYFEAWLLYLLQLEITTDSLI